MRWATGIEDTFIAQAEAGRRRLDEYELLQHYDNWRADIDLAADLGFDTIRYGVPWHRVEPVSGCFEWAWMDEVIEHIVERGLEAIIDLVHYGAPLWLEDQTLNVGYSEHVAAYAGAFATRYRDSVRFYTPSNEPFVHAELCGRTGRWPPYLASDEGMIKILHAIARGIVLTVRALRDARADAVIVHVEDTRLLTTLQPALESGVSRSNELHLAALELVQGRVDRHHVLHPVLIGAGIGERALEWYRDNAIEIDVLGLNYYPDLSVLRCTTNAGGHVVQEPMWGGGEYLERALRRYHARYGLALMITETSVNERAATLIGCEHARRDSLRSRWLEEALDVVGALREEGLPILGFTWWPLYDLVNWDYREGTAPAADYLEPMGLCSLRADRRGRLRREPLAVAAEMSAAIRAARNAAQASSRPTTT